MRKGTSYPSEFKLDVVKDYLNTEKTYADIYEEYNVSSSTLAKWIKKYEESGYDDNVFKSRKSKSKSIISDFSKVPPVIYDKFGIEKSNNKSNEDITSLKRKLSMYEKSLLEKELENQLLREQNEILKKTSNSFFC